MRMYLVIGNLHSSLLRSSRQTYPSPRELRNKDEWRLPMTKYIRIDYVVKPDVDLDELKGAIVEFVAGIHAHHPEHRYTSFQHPSDPLRFIHIGEVVEEVLPDLQKQPFFLPFTVSFNTHSPHAPT